MNDSLKTLLDRCHRDELLPLATLLGVSEKGLGLGDLAQALSDRFRAKATHGLRALFTNGKLTPYEEILAAYAKKLKLPPGDLEATELAIVHATLVERWAGLPVIERQRVWSELGMADAPPADGREALNLAGGLLGRSLGYEVTRLFHGAPALGISGLALAISLLGPFGIPFRLMFAPFLIRRMFAPDDNQTLLGILEIARLRQVALYRVTIGVVGSPSTGKDAAIKALFGIDSGNVSPIAGSTKAVTIQRVPGATALYIVNTPGMGDVIEQVTEQAKQVLAHIDVYVYLVNAEGGVQAREKGDYQKLVATRKPVLAVVNKVDVLRPRDKEKFLDDCRTKLAAKPEDFVATAFDPLPQLSPVPIGRELVREWLLAELAKLGKDTSELPALPVVAVPEPPSEAEQPVV